MKINLLYPKQWILNKIGNHLAKLDCVRSFCYDGQIPKTVFEEINRKGSVNYFVHYVKYVPNRGINGALFTHPEDDSFYNIGKSVSFGVSLCPQYEKYINNCTTITPGIDQDFLPKLNLVFVGNFRSPIKHYVKGKDLLDKVGKLKFVNLKSSLGRFSKEQVIELYNQADYVLITSRVEGVPMPLLEGMAMGKKVICPPDIGLAPELVNFIIPYEKSNWDSLLEVLTKLYEEKLVLRKCVEKYTWDAFKSAHESLFKKLLDEKMSGILL